MLEFSSYEALCASLFAVLDNPLNKLYAIMDNTTTTIITYIYMTIRLIGIFFFLYKVVLSNLLLSVLTATNICTKLQPE